ncbi:MAG: hypothetical protein O7F74_05925, partial [Bacteroidetes bacterium]|nr:hypothetical protein [Bacteroidota bacterium]
MRSWKNKLLILTVISFLSLAGCDPNDFELPTWEVDVFAPLIDEIFDFNDISFPSESRISETDSNDVVVLAYMGNDTTPTVRELLGLLDFEKNFTLPGLPGELDDFQLLVPFLANQLNIDAGDFNNLPPFQKGSTEQGFAVGLFQSSKFKKGQLIVELENRFPFTIDSGLEIIISNKQSGETIFTHIVPQPILPNGTYTAPSQSLKNITVENDVMISLVNFSSQGGTNLSIIPTDQVLVRLELQNLVLKSAVISPDSVQSLTSEFPLAFEIPSGAQITSATIDTGSINVSLEEELAVGLELKVRLLSFTNNGSPLVLDLENKSQVKDLSGLNVDFTLSQPPFNQLLTEITLSTSSSNPIEITFNRPIKGSIQVSSLGLDLIEGYFGKYSASVSDSLEVDFFSKIRSGEIFFTAPEIVLEIDNELGVPVKIKQAQIVGINPLRSGDKEFTIGNSLDGLVIKAAATPGESAKTIIRISRTTETEFEAFISLIPSNIRFDFEMQVGTGKPDLNQFVGKDNKVRISFQFRLPLILELNQLVISDTLAFNLGLGVGKNKLLSGSLISTSLSLFPFELGFQ